MLLSQLKIFVQMLFLASAAKRGKNNTLYMGQSGSWTGPFSPDRDIACGFILGIETVKAKQILPGYEFEYQVSQI